MHQDHTHQLDEDGPVLLTTQDLVGRHPNRASEILDHSLIVTLPPSPAVTALVDAHGWPATRNAAVRTRLGDVQRPSQMPHLVDKNWLTVLRKTFEWPHDPLVPDAPRSFGVWEHGGFTCWLAAEIDLTP